MRFDAIDGFDPGRQTSGPVARPRAWVPLIAAVGTLVAGVALVAFMHDRVFRFVSGPFLILFSLIFFRLWRRASAARAWLVAVDGQGLSIMLRSPLRDPADPHEQTVVTLPWREVAWARPVRERRMTRAPQNERRIETIRYLDVAVRDVDVSLLARKVDEAFETPSKFRNTHRQSTLVDGNVLRLFYSGPALTMGPSLKQMLRALDGHTTVQEELKFG